MDVRIRSLASRQHDIVAGWQLEDEGLGRKAIKHATRRRGWRVVHPGVYCLTSAPMTREQRWVAATLTARNTLLSHASAGSCWGFRPIDAPFETVVRAGSGGPRRMG